MAQFSSSQNTCHVCFMFYSLVSLGLNGFLNRGRSRLRPFPSDSLQPAVSQCKGLCTHLHKQTAPKKKTHQAVTQMD